MPESAYDAYHRQQQEREQRARLGIANELQYDPDRAGRVHAVAARTKLPSSVVDADLESLEAKVRKSEFNYDNYTDADNGSPIFNKFAAEDPYNLAVLERDRESMTALERTLHPLSLGWDAGWATVEMNKIGGRYFAGDRRPGDEERLKELNQLLAGGSFGADNVFAKALIFTAKQLPIQGHILGQAVDEAMIGGMAGALVGGTVLPGVGTVPGFFTGIGAGLWTGRTMAAGEFERNLAYLDFIELGLNERDSRIAANGVGAINGALESIGLGALTKRIPGFREVQRDVASKAIEKIFAGPRMRDAIGRTAAQYGEGMATEIVTEILQEVTLMTAKEHLKADQRATGDTRPELAAMDSDEFWQSIRDIAVETMYSTSIIGGIGPMQTLRAKSRQALRARQQQQIWRALGEAVEGSETRTKVPSAWKEFIERVQKDGPIDEVRVDAEGWRRYWQSKNIDPEEAAAELGVDLSESEAYDVDITIPLAAYVDKIAPTEHHAGLMPDLRIREDDMTFREQQQWVADRDKHTAEIEKALAEQFDMTVNDEMVADLKGQLITMYDEKAAEKMARFHAAVITTTAAREGKDPMALYKQTLIGVRKETPEALAGTDVDIEIDPILDRIRAKDFPRQKEIFGESLIDLIRSAGGIQDQGGELSSRDFGKQFPGIISKTGLTLDGAAELAQEQGYIAELDQWQLMEAIDRELAGNPVFSRNAQVNEDLQKTLDLMEQAESFFEGEGIDLTTMTNQEVREKLKAVTSLDQMDSDDLASLLTTLGAMIDNDPSLMAEIMRQLPRVDESQDFRDVEFTGKFVDEAGKTGKYRINAQKAYDEAVKERNALKQLMECVSG